MKVLVLGSQGMLGHQVINVAKELGHEVVGTTRKEFDAMDWLLGRRIVDAELNRVPYGYNFSGYDVVINCIGVVKPLSNPITSIPINSWFPHMLAEVLCPHGIKLVHISTDCVFDGANKDYNEESRYTCDDLYGMSKALGEVINKPNTLTVRTSIIGDELVENPRGLMDWFLNNKDSNTVNGFANHYWSGLTTRELAKQVFKLLESNATGLRVVACPDPIDKYSLLKLLNKHFGRKIRIKPHNTEKPVFRTMFSIHDPGSKTVPPLGEQIKELAEWCKKNRSDKYGT